jgi:hypothetical protein
LTFTKILIALPPALQKRGCTEIFNKHNIVHCLVAISSGDLQLKTAGIAGSTLLTFVRQLYFVPTDTFGLVFVTSL